MSSLPPVSINTKYVDYWVQRYDGITGGNSEVDTEDKRFQSIMSFLGELQKDYTTICTRLEDRIHELQDASATLANDHVNAKINATPESDQDDDNPGFLFLHSSLAEDFYLFYLFLIHRLQPESYGG